MSASVARQQTELLTSWKEIAAYLGKGVRTVQRWELQFGLPVRRPNEKVKGIVHATREELDHWLQMQWSQRPKESAHTAPPRSVDVHAIHMNLKQLAELRHANRRLMEDLRASLTGIFAECRLLTNKMNGGSPSELK